MKENGLTNLVYLDFPNISYNLCNLLYAPYIQNYRIIFRITSNHRPECESRRKYIWDLVFVAIKLGNITGGNPSSEGWLVRSASPPRRN